MADQSNEPRTRFMQAKVEAGGVFCVRWVIESPGEPPREVLESVNVTDPAFGDLLTRVMKAAAEEAKLRDPAIWPMGEATLADDGTLCLRLHAGEAKYLRPSDPGYEDALLHVGPLIVGQPKPYRTFWYGVFEE